MQELFSSHELLTSSFSVTNADPIARLGRPGSWTNKLKTPILLPKQGSNEIGVGSGGSLSFGWPCESLSDDGLKISSRTVEKGRLAICSISMN